MRPNPASGPDLGRLEKNVISVSVMPCIGSQSSGQSAGSSSKSPAPCTRRRRVRTRSCRRHLRHRPPRPFLRSFLRSCPLACLRLGGRPGRRRGLLGRRRHSSVLRRRRSPPGLLVGGAVVVVVAARCDHQCRDERHGHRLPPCCLLIVFPPGFVSRGRSPANWLCTSIRQEVGVGTSTASSSSICCPVSRSTSASHDGFGMHLHDPGAQLAHAGDEPAGQQEHEQQQAERRRTRRRWRRLPGRSSSQSNSGLVTCFSPGGMPDWSWVHWLTK